MRLVIYKFGMLVMLENVPFQKRPTIDMSKCVYSGVLRKLAYYYSPPLLFRELGVSAYLVRTVRSAAYFECCE